MDAVSQSISKVDLILALIRIFENPTNLQMASTYLDSSALGMLLLLRDHAGGDTANIKIVNCNPDVKKILTISNFEQLFSID